MDQARSIGRHTVAEARGDKAAITAINALTGLSVNDIVRTLADTRGATQLRNAFRDAWPLRSSALGAFTVAAAREHDLREEIEAVTGATRHLVSRRLNSASRGKQLLRNLFWDWWPDDETGAVDSGNDTSSPSDAPEVDPNRTTQEVPSVTAQGSVISGRYTLGRQLGQGGFGTTWEAHDRLTELDLVLKLPHTDDGGAIRNELRQAFQLLHPNICQSFPDRDDDTGRPFLVMQHGGEDLVQRLERTDNAPFPLVLAIHVLVSIADALDYLHDRSVLHLDVTPKNILIDADDVVRLTDFGASAQARAHTTAAGHRTRMATSLHSFNHCYAAPELFDGIGRSRSDQYGLFLVFCSLLEGRPRTKPAAYHSTGDFEMLSQGQNAIIRKALSANPDDRFESCGEPARALADEMTNVPAQILAGDFSRIADDFVRRVDLERQRTSPGTARLGGALKLGRGLERFLQAALVWLAALDGFAPLEALRKIDQHASSVDRSTAGTLMKTITMMAVTSLNIRPELQVIVNDAMMKKASKLWALINARNDVIHGRRPAEAIVPYAAAVADLIRE